MARVLTDFMLYGLKYRVVDRGDFVHVEHVELDAMGDPCWVRDFLVDTVVERSLSDNSPVLVAAIRHMHSQLTGANT